MKRNRLTLTRMALGSLRGQKKRYFALASGIFLAVFFATALVLASASLGKTALDDYRARMGEQDIALLDAEAAALYLSSFSAASFMSKGGRDAFFR